MPIKIDSLEFFAVAMLVFTNLILLLLGCFA